MNQTTNTTEYQQDNMVDQACTMVEYYNELESLDSSEVYQLKIAYAQIQRALEKQAIIEGLQADRFWLVREWSDYNDMCDRLNLTGLTSFGEMAQKALKAQLESKKSVTDKAIQHIDQLLREGNF